MTLAIVLITILFMLVQTFSYSKLPKLDRRISGGKNANINDHLYMLSLQSLRGHFCGACILTEKKSLTAAHCTYGKFANQLMVRACSNNTDFGGELVQVADIKLHPNFNLNTGAYDVSILILETPIINGIRINLPSPNQVVPVGDVATVAGWGKTKENGNAPYHLQKVNIKRITDKKCNSSYDDKITSSMFCFSSNKRDSCRGDSGGPLLYKDQLAGIVSWGQGCGSREYPGVYVRVAEPLIYTYIIDNIN